MEGYCVLVEGPMSERVQPEHLRAADRILKGIWGDSISLVDPQPLAQIMADCGLVAKEVMPNERSGQTESLQPQSDLSGAARPNKHAASEVGVQAPIEPPKSPVTLSPTSQMLRQARDKWIGDEYRAARMPIAERDAFDAGWNAALGIIPPTKICKNCKQVKGLPDTGQICCSGVSVHHKWEDWPEQENCACSPFGHEPTCIESAQTRSGGTLSAQAQQAGSNSSAPIEPRLPGEHDLLRLAQEFVRMIDDNWELPEEKVFEDITNDWFLAWFKSFKREIKRTADSEAVASAPISKAEARKDATKGEL
jgi:hypothetical protein